MDAFYLIFAAGLFMGFANFFIDRHFGIRKKTAAIQKEVNDWNKEYMAALKANDEPRIAELKKTESAVMGKMSEMMFLPLKSAVFIIPLYLGVNWGLNKFIPKGTHFTLPFAVPNFNIVTWDNDVGITGLLVLTVLVSGIIINVIAPMVEKAFEKKDAVAKVEKV